MTSQTVHVVSAVDLPHSFPIEAFDGRVTFSTAHTDEELRAAAPDADILYSWQVPSSIPSGTPRLRWIQLPSAGADHIRQLPVWQSDIRITAAKGIHIVPMSEHLFAMILALSRRIPEIVRAQDKREWIHDWRGPALRASELRGKTLGIVGWGKIGDGVAHLARAFGMRVIGTRWSIVVPREEPRTVDPFTDPPWLEPIDLPPDIVYPAAQLHDVLAQSDIVVSILPLTRETHHTFKDNEFGVMRRGAIFVNIGRGPVVDEAALLRALRSGHLYGAALDVFEAEPLPRQHPLWNQPNIIVSPHLGGMSDRTRERAAQFFAVNLSRYLDGEPLLNEVDRHQEY